MNWLRTLFFGPLTRDRCEVCGAHLRTKQRVEIAEVITEGDRGGSAMIATFCRKDAP